MVRPETVHGPLDPLSAAMAERAIRRCLVDYCRGIDRCDADLVSSVYHPDATDDHGSFVGSGADFARLATTKLRSHARATTHFIGEPIIDFVSATVAQVETPVIAWHRVADAEGEFLENFCGRYFDRFECRAGDWRIADRRLTHDWDTKVRVEPAFPPGTFAPSPRSE
ncbi:MAG: nuclear transport factor 2 family protein [Actinomycetota bacterium]